MRYAYAMRHRIRTVLTIATLSSVIGGCKSSKEADRNTAKDVKAAAGLAQSDVSPNPNLDAENAPDDAMPELAEQDTTEEAPDVRPEDYGQFKSPAPPPAPEDLVAHAMAGYEIVAIYAQPNMESEKLGFLRMGTRMKVTQRISTEGCKKGWYQLPSGGYACASKGLVVEDTPPYMKYPPVAPKDEPAPYDWAYVREVDTPMWWRIPTEKEYALAKKIRDARAAKRQAEQDATASDSPTPTTKKAVASTDSIGGDATKLPSVAAIGSGSDASALPPGARAAMAAGRARAAAQQRKDAATDPSLSTEPTLEELEEMGQQLPLSPGSSWLEKGHFISLDTTIEEGGRTFWHTARGGFVEQKDARPYTMKDYQGVEITEEMDLSQVGFVMAQDAWAFEEPTRPNGKPKKKRKLERREFVHAQETVELQGNTFFRGADGLLVPTKVVRQPSVSERPEELRPWEPWIDVDLSKQMLVAYEGDRPVYLTLVSSGREGTEDEPFGTPRGQWRVYSKQMTSNMDGTTASDGTYALQDVPWVMYFHGSYALHGAFWHNNFGYVRSHGCINLGPSDARWLFHWATPYLPQNWHGIHKSSLNPGTMVVIHGEAPFEKRAKKRRARG